jgi:hypothetical protein
MWTEQLYNKESSHRSNPRERKYKLSNLIVNLKVNVLQEHILKEESITLIPEKKMQMTPCNHLSTAPCAIQIDLQIAMIFSCAVNACRLR